MLTSPRSRQSSPILGIILGIVFLALGANEARHTVRVHFDGHRALARVAGVTHGSRHRSSTTRLSYTTVGGAASECTMNGNLGEIGRPVWIRYLSTDATRCEADELGHALEGPIVHVGLALLMFLGAFFAHRRAQRAVDDPRRWRGPT